MGFAVYSYCHQTGQKHRDTLRWTSGGSRATQKRWTRQQSSCKVEAGSTRSRVALHRVACAGWAGSASHRMQKPLALYLLLLLLTVRPICLHAPALFRALTGPSLMHLPWAACTLTPRR
jgi:hypothetical protein